MSKISETEQHRRLKELLAEKLKEWFGVCVPEYPSAGHELDIFGVTPEGVSIYIEIIWSPSRTHFLNDINMLQQSDADVKVAIASPEIISKEEFRREFSKVAIAQRREGQVFHGEMLNGEKILQNKGFMDSDLKGLFTQLVAQVAPLKKRPPRPKLKFPQPQISDTLPDEISDRLLSNLFPVASMPKFPDVEQRRLMEFLNNALYTYLKSNPSLQQHPIFRSTYFYKPDNSKPRVVDGRIVASPEYLPSGELHYWVHDSVTLRFVALEEMIFLLVEPCYVFTEDEEKLLPKEKAGPLTTKKIAHEFNRQYLQHIRFWISTLATDKDKITIPTSLGSIVISVSEAGVSVNFGGGSQVNSQHDFQSWHVNEPELFFGGGNRHVDQKIGLTLYGPAQLPDKADLIKSINVGIVGTGETVGLAEMWMEKLKREIPSKKESVHSPSFMGFEKTFNCVLNVADQWKEIIPEKEIQQLADLEKYKDCVNKAVDLFVERLQSLVEREPRPQIVICAIPQALIRIIGSRKTSVAVPEENDVADPLPEAIDFRRALKAKAMGFGIPTQLAKESTFTGKTTTEERPLQDEAMRAWNFSVALYYKAGGLPWRLAEASPRTCYIGVSFYREYFLSAARTRTSLVQIFTYTGEGLVLRGDRFEWDKKMGKSPHLSKQNAFKLLRDAMDVYQRHMGQTPARVVIHKSSRYWSDELAGFREACQGIGKVDFVSVGRRGIRFLRQGLYPPLRGTVIQLSKHNYLVYTRGYVPLYRTYPGLHVPHPLEILEHHGDSDIRTVCKEILGLTKMNWNNADYSIREPVTLRFSREIGAILANVPEAVKPRPQYLFYM